MIWKALRSAPVATSPSNCVSALARLAPVNPNRRHEGRRQRAAVVKEVVERIGDITLVMPRMAALEVSVVLVLVVLAG